MELLFANPTYLLLAISALLTVVLTVILICIGLIISLLKNKTPTGDSLQAVIEELQKQTEILERISDSV